MHSQSCLSLREDTENDQTGGTSVSAGSILSRGRKWRDYEDKRVALAYMKVCYDPVTSNQQTGVQMWARIYDEAITPAGDVPALKHRTAHAIQTRWGIITHRCSKYQAFYDSAGRNVPSGSSPEQWQRDEANRRFREFPPFKGASWSMQETLDILNKSPKWRRANSLEEALQHLDPSSSATTSSSTDPLQAGSITDPSADGSTRKRSSAVLDRPPGRDRGRAAKNRQALDRELLHIQRRQLDEQVKQGKAAKDAKTFFIAVHAASLTPDDTESQDLLKAAREQGMRLLRALDCVVEEGSGTNRSGTDTHSHTHRESSSDSSEGASYRVALDADARSASHPQRGARGAASPRGRAAAPLGARGSRDSSASSSVSGYYPLLQDREE
eukprot:GHVU01001904.1.p1 GENE.GHVU01001904.1~~GHVU01001904.1.p1  ORF type:complete len:384 (+),score=34.14 GHVU01001904.1:362-1513(+)